MRASSKKPSTPTPGPRWLRGIAPFQRAAAQGAAAQSTASRPARSLGFALRSALPLALLLAAACMGPQTPQGKADEAIREFNEATRWGRMDLAIDRASSEHREEFMKNHESWHNSLRIMEAELAGMQLSDATHAKVQVDVHWTMSDDTTLRVTRLEQTWIDNEGKWTLMSEKRIAGAEGLFGEEVERDEPKKDSHFPTRVIH